MKFTNFCRAFAFLAAFAMITPAYALEVEEAEVEKGLEIETESTYTDDNGGNDQYEHANEIEIALGITDWLRFAFEVDFVELEEESPFRLTEWTFNVIIELIDPNASMFGVAIYAGIEHERSFEVFDEDDGEFEREEGDNEFFIGLILEKEIQQITLRTNLLYVSDLNEADETFEGYDIFYQAIYNLPQNLNLGFINIAGVGVEGYYFHRDPDEAGEETTDTHLVGPVLYFEGGPLQMILNAAFGGNNAVPGDDDDDDENGNGDDDDEGVEVSGNIGVLFGSGDDAADITIKWNSEIEF